jgi:hypothetical protein
MVLYRSVKYPHCFFIYLYSVLLDEMLTGKQPHSEKVREFEGPVDEAKRAMVRSMPAMI